MAYGSVRPLGVCLFSARMEPGYFPASWEEPGGRSRLGSERFWTLGLARSPSLGSQPWGGDMGRE